MSMIRNQLNTISNFRVLTGSTIIQIRNHTERKPNLRKPKEPDYRKKLLLSLIKPFYAKDKRPDSEKCLEWKEQRKYEPHPYVRMLSEDCTKELNSKYVYLLHLNSISEHNFNQLRKEFLKKNLYLRNYLPEVIELSIKNTRLSNLIDIFKHYTCFACSEKEQIDDVKKLCKSSDRIELLGGIFENRILNLKQVEEYKKLGNLDNVRSQFCNLLTVHNTQLSSLLSHHTNELSFNLKNYVNKDNLNDEKNVSKQENTNNKTDNV